MRAKIDALLRDAMWNITDGRSVHFEYSPSDGKRADHVLCDRRGRPMAVMEAKKRRSTPSLRKSGPSVRLDVAFAFLSNGEEVWFYHRAANAHGLGLDIYQERRIAVNGHTITGM